MSNINSNMTFDIFLKRLFITVGESSFEKNVKNKQQYDIWLYTKNSIANFTPPHPLNAAHRHPPPLLNVACMTHDRFYTPPHVDRTRHYKQNKDQSSDQS